MGQLNHNEKGQRFLFLRLLFPFLVWAFLFRDFINGNIAINVDTQAHYAFIKFFLNNIQNGTLPLWNPFTNLGHPYAFLVTTGVFNPLQTATVFILKFSGLNYYQAYMIYLVAYYFVGMAGFYLLARVFLKDERYAFLAYFALLFSGTGATIFNQVNMLLIFVPSVWFLYFFVKFARSFQKPYFIGLIFCTMLVMISYLPFYFVTLFFVFAVCFGCLYPVPSKGFIAGFLDFIRKNAKTTLIGLMALGIAFIPLSFYKFSDAKGENVIPIRHCRSGNSEECIQHTFHGTAKMSLGEASGGSLGGRFNFHNQFSNLDKVSYAQDSLFYVPFFCYLLIFISLFTVFDRKLILLCATGLFIFLIALADLSFVHGLLYRCLFYFKYFRNLFFFMAFLMPILVLIAVVQLKAVLEYKVSSRKSILAVIFLTHLAFFLFLWSRGNVICTSYITVIGSWLFFTAYFSGLLEGRKSCVMGGLVCLMLLQPLQFFTFYRQNASAFKCAVPYEHVSPGFFLARPAQKLKSACKIFKYFPAYIDFWHTMMMQDSPGITGLSGNMSRWAFLLAMKIDARVFMNYVKNKLVLYDDVEYLAEDNLEESLRTLENALGAGKNSAYISEKGEDILLTKKTSLWKQWDSPLVVKNESERVRVLGFNVNSLELSTRFDSPKFLVYNDSFNSHWEVFVNGRKKKLYRANMAFKGVYLPAGRNTVHFKYSPPGGEGIYYFVLIFYFLFFLYTCWALNNQRKRFV